MSVVVIIRDALARLVRVLDALSDGEYDLATAIGDDLEADLRSALDRFDRGDAA